MSEKTKKALIELLRAVLAAVVSLVTALTASGCGTTRAVITNRADNTTTDVKITTSNPTTVNVSPTTTVDFIPSK